MGLKRVSWVRRYQGQCRALRPLGHQGYRLRNHKKDQPLCSGYTWPLGGFLCWSVVGEGVSGVVLGVGVAGVADGVPVGSGCFRW